MNPGTSGPSGVRRRRDATRVRAWLLFLTLAGWSLLSVGLATTHAQDDRSAARAAFEAGRRAYETGAFREALEHFQEAYRLAPHPSVRVNIASCYDQLDRPIEALFHYEQFLGEAGRVAAVQRREVEAAIARLRSRVGAIALQITPDGALVTIDGTETRRTPVPEPVRVVAGSHTVEVQLEGYRPERRTVVVGGGESVRVALRLARAETAPSATSASTASASTPPSTPPTSRLEPTIASGAAATDVQDRSEPRSEDSAGERANDAAAPAPAATTPHTAESGNDSGDIRLTAPVLVAGGVTAAALVGALVFGPLALSANASFEDAVRRSNDPELPPEERARAHAEGRGAANDASTFAAVTDVLLIAAAVGAGASTALFVIAQGESDREESATVSAVPRAGPGLFGVSLSGRF